MKSHGWSNTALVAFSAIPKIICLIDFGVRTRVKSGFMSRHLSYGLQNEELFNEIIELNNEKAKMLNLKYIIEATFERLTRKEREILKKRYIEKKTFQKIAEETDVCIRTVFRRLDGALHSFGEWLEIQGFTEEWFEKEYGRSKYIKQIRDKISNYKYLTTNI